jgi:hypothetical protein
MKTPTTNPIRLGGCLCGEVRYEAQPDKPEGYYCHCRMCQLAFGNTRAAFLNLRKDELRWLGPAPAYYASSKIARRGFCNRCGTPLTFEYPDSERMDISIGSLDDPAAIKPTTHFGVESRIASWHAEDGLPALRLDEHAKIMGRWKATYGADVIPGLATTRNA